MRICEICNSDANQGGGAAFEIPSNDGDNGAADGISVGLSGILEENLGVTELIERPVEGDEVFVEVELANDVVAGREDEGVGIVVITADELIVAVATIEGV